MDNALIKKKIISAGTRKTEYPNDSKVKFHYCTKTCEPEPRVLDDSRKENKPMELVIGKKFKLEVWEASLKTMSIGEVASFTVDKSLVNSYPFVAKTLRDTNKPPEMRVHTCGATLHAHGIGYDDLNELIKSPQDLEFVFEVLEVQTPDKYNKDTWQMDEQEKRDIIPVLKEEGNILFKQKDYVKASEKYATAIGILEQLMLKEKPKEEDWLLLNTQKLPILLNYAQCKMLEKDYYSAIEHCTTVLEYEPKNVKALYRRGKAHLGAWNFDEAEEDFRKAAEIDPTLSNLVLRELREIQQLRRQQDLQDRQRYQGKLF